MVLILQKTTLLCPFPRAQAPNPWQQPLGSRVTLEVLKLANPKPIYTVYTAQIIPSGKNTVKALLHAFPLPPAPCLLPSLGASRVALGGAGPLLFLRNCRWLSLQCQLSPHLLAPSSLHSNTAYIFKTSTMLLTHSHKERRRRKAKTCNCRFHPEDRRWRRICEEG